MKDDEPWDFEKQVKPYRGVFVVNEGNFTAENASLTYYDMVTGEAFNDVFFNTNGLPLGDVAVSMVIRDSLGYVVVNNSGRIYVLNTHTFEYVGKITGLTSPRHIHFVSDTKAYVTDLYARSIAVVNPVTMEITGSIDVNNRSVAFSQHSTEQMEQFGKYVYVNCWSFDNMILVIDTEADRVVDSVEVLKQPNSMVMDRSDNLWILTDGGYPGSPYGYEAAGLLKIAPGERIAQVVRRFTEGESPGSLRINGGGDTLYYLNYGVYRQCVTYGSKPELFIPGPGGEGGPGWYYGLDIDKSTSEVYVSDALDFVQRGWIYRYSPGGVPLDTFQAGIIPASFCFKPQ